ncbi:MAG: hypothetical protein J6D37_00840 [Clostridia bacterium]|nr:hypothetical protein [Clostridia bacterium]
MEENIILIVLFFSVMIFGFFATLRLGGFLEDNKKSARKRRHARLKDKQSKEKKASERETEKNAEPKNK